ncbi:MAG: acyltransferase [Candidatus Atribacteria bacterium]|nr:acyltransferase [Candidatus Atribacteria bacterium]
MYSLKNYVLQGIFQALYSFVKYFSFPLMNYIRYAVLVFFVKKIRSKSISEGVTFWFPWKIEIGKNTTINQNCIIDGSGGISIGNDVRIAPYVIFNTVDHEYSKKEIPIRKQAYIAGRIIIENDVWIGANVVINKGVRIGKGSVIGSGSIVTRNIPPYSVAYGIPCKVVRTR